MVEKIVSYALMEITNLHIEEKAIIYCKNYTSKLITTFLEADFFIYERDDIREGVTNRERYFYDRSYHGQNEWEEMEEPVR
jgi:hypothetical protein